MSGRPRPSEGVILGNLGYFRYEPASLYLRETYGEAHQYGHYVRRIEVIALREVPRVVRQRWDEEDSRGYG